MGFSTTCTTLLLVLVNWSSLCNSQQQANDLLPCIDNTWTYSNQTGKCYKFLASKVNYTEAFSGCQALAGSSSIMIKSLEFNTTQEVVFLRSFVTQNNFTYPIWTTGQRISGKVFMWQPSNTTINYEPFFWNGGTDSGNCISFTVQNNRATLDQSECFDRMTAICEHYVKRCMNPPGNLDEAKVQLPVAYPGCIISSKCRYGYAMVSNPSNSSDTRISGSNVDSNLERYQYSCKLASRPQSESTPIDPNTIETTFFYSGYPSINCSILECNISEIMAMKSPSAIITQVVDLSTDEVLPTSSSLINTFNKRIDISCPSEYFYNDRTTTKQVYCAVNETDNTKSYWKAYPGTILPLPKVCNEVKCLSLEASPTPSMMIQDGFDIIYTNGTHDYRMNHESFTYKFNDRVIFTCANGYTSLDLNTTQTLACGPKGKWVPALGDCIKKPIDLTNIIGNRYQSTVVEASNSNQIGQVIMGIIIGFFILIGLIDLVGITEDYRFLKQNILIQLWELGLYSPKKSKKSKKPKEESRQALIEHEEVENQNVEETISDEIQGENQNEMAVSDNPNDE